MEKEKSPAVQGRKALTIPKRSDGMPDYNAVTEFAKLNSITTLKDLEKLGSPISGDEYVLMTKLRCRLKKFIIPPKSKFARAYMADIAENLKNWDEEAK